MPVVTDPSTAPGALGEPTAIMMELLDRLRALTERARRPDLSAHLTQAQGRVLDPRLRIVVTGQTGQGMTTLVEELIGAPMSTLPTSPSGPIIASYSASPFVRPVNRDDAGEEPGPLPRVEVGAPNDLLAEGIVLIDTPGVSGTEPSRTGLMLSLLPSADAVVFVSDASQEYIEPEITLLKQIQRLCPTVIGAITKIDLYPRWADIQRANRTHLTNAGLDLPLLPLSATMSRSARTGGDPTLAVESGMPQLIEFLRHRVMGNADLVLRNAVINDIRFMSDQLALALNAELDALNDAGCGAELVQRLSHAREAAQALRERTANWQLLLGEGMTELAVDVEHDLRHRLRSVIRQAEADIMTCDPAKCWDEFASWLNGRIAESVQENFVLAHTRCGELAATVAARFVADGRTAVPPLHLDRTESLLDPVQPLEPLQRRTAGILQRVITSMRGSYGGVLMVGLMTSLAGLALVNPWSIGAGLLLGANTFWEDRKAQQSRRQAEAKAAVTRFMDDVIFQVGKESKDRLREAQRTLRDHFTRVATEMLRSADEALRAAQEATEVHANHRARRIAELHDTLSQLRQLRVRAAALVPTPSDPGEAR
jgi:ethanolamine utilization protein EutP (predicted NTPase)